MKLLRFSVVPALGLIALSAPQAKAFWVDGDGHYGLRGATETSPEFQHQTGTYQAIEQTFRLTGEARFNDQLSMYMELGIFDDPRRAYLGDVGQPADCAGRTGTDKNNPCGGQHQNTGEPGYQPYAPKVTKAYVRYAFDYCILEAGRRGRNWGLGMFLDDGTKPFSTSASIFDGFTCNINIQKSQTLGFSVGYDKLSETGKPVDSNWQSAEPYTRDRQFGPNDPFDDLDQYFFTIEYDDRKTNAGAAFTKQIGVYFAEIMGKPYKTVYTPQTPAPGQQQGLKETGGDGTDLKFLDLYTGFYLGDFALRNEVLFRMGKSMDPNWLAMGGEQYYQGQPAMNNLDSVAVAGDFEWTLAHSGAPIGPADFNKGDMTRHVLFLNYAYAPGDGDGYRNFNNATDATDKVSGLDPNLAQKLTKSARSSSVKAMEFHRNFKPALLLFNARPQADDLIVDGTFNPSRMVNATLVAAGYRYESMETGDFEVKLLTASLNEGPPNEIKQYYAALKASGKDDGSRPVGFYGKNLGVELDLTYTYKIGREAELGAAAAAALPGKAWQIYTGDIVGQDSKPATDFLLQTTATFHF